jgi:curved DNA-binding protein CbpA
MNREDHRKYFDVLELPTDADLSDVKKAYVVLKDIYTKESIVTMSMLDDITDEHKKEILAQIDEAYQVLSSLFSDERNKVVDYIGEIVAGIEVFDGPSLKMIREKMRFSLDDVAMATRVLRKHLENIEEENFKELPVAVYTRGFVANYAKFLSLEQDEVAASYMEKFQVWRDEKDLL